MASALVRAVSTADVRLDMSLVDYALLIIYFVFVLGIGMVVRRSVKSSRTSSWPAGRLPAWIAGLAFITANLGAIEILGFAAERGPVRLRERPLLLDRRDPRDGVPRRRHDAVLLRVEDPQRPRVPAAPVQRPTHLVNAVSFAPVGAS